MRVSPTLAVTTEGLKTRLPSPTVIGILAARLRGRREKRAVARMECILILLLMNVGNSIS